MSNNKMKYVIFPDGNYLVTVEDYDGKPYTFEVSGAAIAAHLRTEALLTREWDEQYNDVMNGDLNEL
jgi:hypothetical protein